MRKLPRHKLLATGLVVVAAAAGGGAAVAGAAGSGSPGGFLDSVAKHLGVSRQKLDEATKAAALDQVDAQLKAGKITQAQADAMKQRIQAGQGGFGFGRGFGPGPGPGGPPHGPGTGLRGALSAAATYLGLSEADLRAKLESGKSLADVAKAQSKDVAGLQDAIVADAKADLDKAVSAKKLTQAQADDILEGLRSHVSDLVNGKLPDGPKFGHRGPGPDGPGWF